MKHLYQLRQIEYAEGAKFTLQNAKNHINVSNEAAKINQFGIANSLLISGLEELAKASILKIKSINNNIRIDNLDEYFRSHTLKHETIYQLFFASFDFTESKENNIPTESIQSNKNFQIVVIIIIVIIGIMIYNSSKKDTREIKIKFNSLEDIRKSGLYLGFDSENRKWEIPNEAISKDDYENFKDIVKTTFEKIEESLFKGNINKKNIVDFAEKLQNENIVTEHLKEIK